MDTNGTKKFDPSKPVQTRDGKKARIICTDRYGMYPIVVLVTENGQENMYTVNSTGKFGAGEYDLVNIPEPPIVTYINVYSNGRGSVKSSRETADIVAGLDRVACVRLEYREGQFDD